MKNFKRNAVIITVLLFVCVAAYLNWSYNNNADNTLDSQTLSSASPTGASPSANASAEPSNNAGLFYEPDTSIDTAYFDSARLNRQQARDASVATLSTVSETENASQEAIDAALAEISQIAERAIKEAALEDLIKAKGFADCVVYMTNDNITVTVPEPAEGLEAAAVARIMDAVTSQTVYAATDLTIIPVK